MIRVLVVEDDADVRHLVRDQMIGLGYAVVAVASAEAALDVLKSDTGFDVLFTDIRMPGGKNGRELADKIATIIPGLPVLYTSGYSAAVSIENGHLAPGMLMLQKPYRRQELARMLTVALDSKRSDPA